MSYKILDCSSHVSDGISDGVVAGVFDECSVSVVDKRVEIAKGKLVLNGIPIIIDGREIIPIPDDYGDGNYYVVGVMKIEDYKPVSFYLSLRDGLNLRRDGIDNKSGIVESAIVEISLGENKVLARRILPILREKNCQKSHPIYLKKALKSGESFNISDATDGEFSKISILGRSTYQKNNYVGVGDFTITSTTGNLFDIEGLEIRDIGFLDGEKFITPNYVWGTVDSVENGISAHGRDVLDDEQSRGLLHINLGKMRAGTYHLSFKAKIEYMYFFMEEEKNVSVEIYDSTDMLTRASSADFETEGDVRDFYTSFTLNNDGVVVLKIFLHGHKLVLTDFCLSKDNKISYIPYGLDERQVEIRDKKGNSYTLLSTDFASDEITFDNDECVLIKRVDVGMSNEVITRPGANYKYQNDRDIAFYDGTMSGDSRLVIYELVNYQRIPLSDECARALRGIRTFRNKTILTTTTTTQKPIIKAQYSKDFYNA